MTHSSIESRAATAIRHAIDETDDIAGLDALERVLTHMMQEIGFEVDQALRSAEAALNDKRSRMNR